MFQRLRERFALYLLTKIKKHFEGMDPDVTVGDNYLRRWHLIPENKFFNVYYHEIRASDLGRHLHDHPYWFSSFILEGGYYEHTVNGKIDRGAGTLNLHSQNFLHRLEMKDSNGANTIFITGPKIKQWGFMTENGWVEKDEYLEMHGIQGALMKPITVDQQPESEETQRAGNGN